MCMAWFNKAPLWLAIAGVVVLTCALTCWAQEPGEADAGEDGQIKVHETEKMTFLELLKKGRWFMLPIALCSLMGLAIIFERLIALRRKAILPPDFMAGLKGVFRHDSADRSAGLDYCHANGSPLALVVAAGIRKLHKADEIVERAIEDAGINEVAKLRRNLRLLYGVSAVAPMLGLLGTVWGLIKAFQAASVMGLGKAEHLATGIYEALVTTFAGLLVAVPVLIFYYYFLGKIDLVVHEMNDVTVEFMDHYKAESAPEQADWK